jgi:hypothetical protein
MTGGCIREGLVVELGGSEGAMCIHLASQYPQIRCISQDLPEVVSSVEVPENVKGRVEVVVHDFFTGSLSKTQMYICSGGYFMIGLVNTLLGF